MRTKLMRTKVFLAGLFAISSMLVMVPAAPASAGGLNCWYEYVYSWNGALIDVIAHCEVESEDVTP